MSFYNMVFGQNPISDAILATLGLTRADCGRFRDCFIADGKIAVYTRNGGGNRGCWHTAQDWYASEECKNESRIAEVDERVEATKEEAEQHPEWTALNVFIGAKRVYGTGRKIQQVQYRCLEPDSAECACPGCIIDYRLPQHPCYIYDEDDDFDSTYATVYFRFPEEYAEELRKLDSGESFDPSRRWLEAIEALKTPG